MVSIIIPCYNVAPYLPTCLDSVLSQNFEELQIICVNDGSTDRSVDILKEYSEMDNRIEIIHQNNAGLSAARNTGLKHVKGEYIMFLDADDWLAADTCRKAYAMIRQHSADIIFWGYSKEYNNKKQIVQALEQEKIFENNDMIWLRRRLLGITGQDLSRVEQLDSLGTAWGKLFKASLFQHNDVVFVDIKTIGSAEDVLCNLYVFAHATKAIYTEDIIHHYRKNNSSALTKTYKKNLVAQWENLFQEMEKWRHKYDDTPESLEALNNRKALALISLGLNELQAPTSLFSKYCHIDKIINKQWIHEALGSLAVDYLPIHWRIFFSLAKYKLTAGVMALLYIIKLALNK